MDLAGHRMGSPGIGQKILLNPCSVMIVGQGDCAIEERREMEVVNNKIPKDKSWLSAGN